MDQTLRGCLGEGRTRPEADRSRLERREVDRNRREADRNRPVEDHQPAERRNHRARRAREGRRAQGRREPEHREADRPGLEADRTHREVGRKREALQHRGVAGKPEHPRPWCRRAGLRQRADRRSLDEVRQPVRRNRVPRAANEANEEREPEPAPVLAGVRPYREARRRASCPSAGRAELLLEEEGRKRWRAVDRPERERPDEEHRVPAG